MDFSLLGLFYSHINSGEELLLGHLCRFVSQFFGQTAQVACRSGHQSLVVGYDAQALLNICV